MPPAERPVWRQVETADSAQMAAFACGDAEVDQMVRGLLLPCHNTVHNGYGPWRSFAVQDPHESGRVVAVAAIEQRVVQPPLFQHEATYIPLIAVHTDYQGFGYSKFLMAKVLDEVRQQRGDVVWAELALGNTKAQRLFSHYDFEMCPVRPACDPNATHAMWTRWK